MKYSILTFIIFLILTTINAQEILIVDLEYKIIKEINSSNDSIICGVISPNPGKDTSENIFPLASQQSIHSQNLPQWYFDETNRRMRERNVQNDYRIKNNYVVYINEDLIEIKRRETIIEYIYSEGCDIDKYVIVKNLKTKNLDDLIFVSSSDIITKENTISYFLLTDSTNWYLKPNKSFTIKNYKIDYTASFSESHFSFQGYGTQNATYFNVELKVNDLKNMKSQILLKVPHINLLGLKSILIADINSDGRDDIILTTIDELCKYNLIYLTTSNNDYLFDFVGYSKECHCP